MKNIYLLPTDKPSQLYNYVERPDKLFLDLKRERTPVPTVQHKNIYITSDEEIKDGDWVYHKLLESVFKIDLREVPKKYIEEKRNISKVTLTTDLELIQNGVQTIDDEFLEWICKNPTCEYVEVSKKGISDHMGRLVYHKYKIIFPKEETKNGSLSECVKSIIDEQLINIEDAKFDYGWCKGNVILPQEEPKQECNWADVEQGCVRDVCKCEQKQYLIDLMQIDEKIAESEKRGQKIVDYLNKYKGQSFYNDIALAIEFGYQLKLKEDERNS